MADLPVISNDAQPTVVVDATTNTNVAKVDSFGNVQVLGGYKYTYSCATAAISVAVGATDAFTISGSATKTIRIVRVTISGTKTTAGQENVLFIQRTTANTGGTSSIVLSAPRDSTNPAATAVCTAYTANPTALGTSTGWMRDVRVFWPALASVAATVPYVVDFTANLEQPVVLRGTGQLLVVNMNGGSIVGDTLYVSIDWTEE